MEWTIPGTVLTGNSEDAPQVRSQFAALFLAGDMVLGQVARLSGLEPYTVQNWVKRGFLPPPVNKHYSMNQLCRILSINMLKGALSLEQICSLLRYINGALDDASDDLIDDAELYFRFVELAARGPILTEAGLEAALGGTPENQTEQRIQTVLIIMRSAWLATRFRQEAEDRMAAANLTTVN